MEKQQQQQFYPSTWSGPGGPPDMGPRTTSTYTTGQTHRHSGRGVVRSTDTAGGEAAKQASNEEGGGAGEVAQWRRGRKFSQGPRAVVSGTRVGHRRRLSRASKKGQRRRPLQLLALRPSGAAGNCQRCIRRGRAPLQRYRQLPRGREAELAALLVVGKVGRLRHCAPVGRADGAIAAVACHNPPIRASGVVAANAAPNRAARRPEGTGDKRARWARGGGGRRQVDRRQPATQYSL